MAFPVNGVLDDFNRANTGPPPSANWTGTNGWLFGDNFLKVITNSLACTSVVADGYWNASLFGPNAELYVTVSTPESFRLGIRIVTPNAVDLTTDGYVVTYLHSGSNITIGRCDNCSNTVIGPPVTQTLSSGNKLYVSAEGPNLKVYLFSGGSWSLLLQRADPTYGGLGYLAVALSSTTTVLDDFGGGTIPYVNESVVYGSPTMGASW